MTDRLLLDEMLSGEIAARLRAQGHDVLAVVAEPALVASPDPVGRADAASQGRALVTRNIKDFMVLDAQFRASGSTHAGLVLVSTKAFPEDRHALDALVRALDKLLSSGGVETGGVVFLQR